MWVNPPIDWVCEWHCNTLNPQSTPSAYNTPESIDTADTLDLLNHDDLEEFSSDVPSPLSPQPLFLHEHTAMVQIFVTKQPFICIEPLFLFPHPLFSSLFSLTSCIPWRNDGLSTINFSPYSLWRVEWWWWWDGCIQPQIHFNYIQRILSPNTTNVPLLMSPTRNACIVCTRWVFRCSNIPTTASQSSLTMFCPHPIW